MNFVKFPHCVAIINLETYRGKVLMRDNKPSMENDFHIGTWYYYGKDIKEWIESYNKYSGFEARLLSEKEVEDLKVALL